MIFIENRPCLLYKYIHEAIFPMTRFIYIPNNDINSHPRRKPRQKVANKKQPRLCSLGKQTSSKQLNYLQNINQGRAAREINHGRRGARTESMFTPLNLRKPIRGAGPKSSNFILDNFFTKYCRYILKMQTSKFTVIISISSYTYSTVATVKSTVTSKLKRSLFYI